MDLLFQNQGFEINREDATRGSVASVQLFSPYRTDFLSPLQLTESPDYNMLLIEAVI